MHSVVRFQNLRFKIDQVIQNLNNPSCIVQVAYFVRGALLCSIFGSRNNKKDAPT